jgi:hypothetical protein
MMETSAIETQNRKNTKKQKKKTFCPGIVKMFLTRYTTRRIVITELLLLLLLLYQNLIFIRPSCVCVCVHHLIRGHRIYIYIYNNTRTGWRKENRAVNLRSSRQGETKDKKTKKKRGSLFFVSTCWTRPIMTTRIKKRVNDAWSA